MRTLCAILLCFISANTLSKELHYVGLQYEDQDVDGISLDGYTAQWRGVFGEKVAVFTQFSDLSVNSVEVRAKSVGLDVAFGSFAEGSPYIGMSVGEVKALGVDVSQTVFALGFAKYSGSGLDYDISAQYDEESSETIFNFLIRGSFGETGAGWSFGAATDGDDHSQSIGVNYLF